MTVLYNQFSIIDVVTDLKTKTIVIATNFKVDPTTINLNTVSLYDYSAGSGQLAEYDLQVKGKDICIILRDFPVHDNKYFLKITDIYDALNRKINYAYNDYIIFESEVVTDVQILSPGFRETFNQETIDIKLKITDPLADGAYKIQVASDNAFFKVVSTIISNATAEEITSSDDMISISENTINEGVLSFKATIKYNGQLFIRARAEASEEKIGQWSQLSSFTINTMPVDSMDTSFLENSLTTYDLFEDDFERVPLAIKDKANISEVTDRVFYMEFNKAIKLPEDYKTDEDGYVCLGIITGFRKGLK